LDVFTAIRNRRSIRHYKPDPIPDDVLERLLNAMRLAPSSKNCQPWKYIVVRDQEVRARVSEACCWWTASGRLVRQDWVAEAPVLIVICGSEKWDAVRYHADGHIVTATWRDMEAARSEGPVTYESGLLPDLAIALDHLTLAAVAEGLGTCWIGGLDEAQLKNILGIPDDLRAPSVMTLGYPVSWPEPRPRKPLEEIVCYDRYG